MSSSQCLHRRASGIYFARFCVPSRFQEAVGKTELHRTTGCRDWRLAKIVAAELAARWHRAIQALDGIDISEIKAGSIALLGDGFISILEASSALGTTPLSLATQLPSQRASMFV